jgi:hypothetical protein
MKKALRTTGLCLGFVVVAMLIFIAWAEATQQIAPSWYDVLKGIDSYLEKVEAKPIQQRQIQSTIIQSLVQELAKIEYEEDVTEELKEPIRFWIDGKGDCEDAALYILERFRMNGWTLNELGYVVCIYPDAGYNHICPIFLEEATHQWWAIEATYYTGQGEKYLKAKVCSVQSLFEDNLHLNLTHVYLFFYGIEVNAPVRALYHKNNKLTIARATKAQVLLLATQRRRIQGE